MSSDYETNAQIHEETNKRISSRNVPSGMLQPYISVRPVMTKYSMLPIVDPRKANTVKMPIYSTYNPNQTFNPGNDTAPWSGYASGVNVESDLRNQIFALQRGSQAVYVPSSGSDLYTYQFRPTKNDYQPFPYLFKKEQFDTFNPVPPNMHQTVFQTSTRVNTIDAPIYTDRFDSN
jgi:hypothetical protein